MGIGQGEQLKLALEMRSKVGSREKEGKLGRTKSCIDAFLLNLDCN